MNNERRKQIAKVVETLQEAQSEITSIASDERDYYDNMPENMRDGDKGQRADEVASELENIDSSLQDLISQLEECV